MPLLSSDDMPRSWRPAWTLMLMVLGVLAAGGSGAAAGLAAVRAEAESVVSKAWNERQRAEVVSIATEAARAGASAAIADQFISAIAPLSTEMKSHEAADDQRHVDLSRRVERLEAQVEQIESATHSTRWQRYPGDK